MAYTRTKKLTDASYSPTNPESETALREQVDGSIQEVLDLLDEGKAEKSEVLQTNNTTVYTPTAQYHPTTKKYVDDAILDIVVGELPEGSVTDDYLSNAPSDIKARVDAHLADFAAYQEYLCFTGLRGQRRLV